MLHEISSNEVLACITGHAHENYHNFANRESGAKPPTADYRGLARAGFGKYVIRMSWHLHTINTLAAALTVRA